MIKKDLNVAWRHLWKAKGYSFINLLGLSVGLAAFLLIFRISTYEFSFDRFHPNADRIYRGVTKRLSPGSPDWAHVSTISSHASHFIRDEYSGIDQIANFYSYSVTVTVPAVQGRTPVTIDDGDKYNMIITDPSWFSIFHYKWIAGSASTAMNDPFRVVLTASRVKAFWGDVAPAAVIGRKLVYDDSLHLTVSGVIEDWAQPSDLHFTDFISYSTIAASFLRNHTGFDDPSKDSWGERTYSQTYILLKKGTTSADFDRYAAGMLASKAPKSVSENKLTIGLQPLAGLHFDSHYTDTYSRQVHRPTLYVMTGIAAFILALAIINFINLATAQAVSRAKEVGTRKILGSGRRAIILQYMLETSILLIFALILTPLFIFAAFRLLPQFIPPGFAPGTLMTPAALGFASIALLGVLFLAGGYPAYILSGFSPVRSLKGDVLAGDTRRAWLRKGLIVFQFTISLVFIISTVIVGRQLHFLLHKDLGVNQTGVVNIDFRHINPNRRYPDEDKKVFATAVQALPGVRHVSLDLFAPTVKDRREAVLTDIASGAQWTLPIRMGDEQYVRVYGLKIIAGRNIRMQRVDTATEFLLSEKATSALGYAKPGLALGRTLTFAGRWTGPVVGILADFNSQSLLDPVKPASIMAITWSPFELSVRLDAATPNLMANIEKTFKRVYPTETFQYTLFKDEVANFYSEEQRLSILINAAMSIAIFLSCMGLFGLSAFTAGRRTKEIGIRKVVGASVAGISMLLIRQFLVLVGLAFLLAIPVGWYFMEHWLQDYPNRIGIHWWMFAAAGSSAILLALVTVAFHAIRAAKANPVTALRNHS